jgi:hypothetical protein
MKNCCAPVPTEQKQLLKVLTCLYENYVKNRTPSTDSYFANPTEEGYASMKTELDAIYVLINNYLMTNNTFVDASGNPIITLDGESGVYLWTANAQGVAAYVSDNTDGSGNTFDAANANTIFIDPNINNVGVLKPVQKLNLDECASKAYQVLPINYLLNNYTEASLVERVGCTGVSNLGFLGMQLWVPIEFAPFNNCYVPKC